MKHFLSLVYVAALALMLSAGASAREITVDGMVFKTNRTAKIATFTKLAKPSDSKWKNQVTIPATVTDGDVKCSVTKIDAGALYEHTTKAVSIPSTVTEIGSYAFYKTEFTEITLPSGLKTLGEGVFKDSKLQKVTIPASVTSIGDYAFSSPNFIKIAFKARTANLTIGMGVFWHAGITNITLPEHTVKIGDNCFYDSKLVTASIPSTLKVISSEAFGMCKSLSKVTIAKGNLVKIASGAFYNSTLSSINIPEGVTVIGDRAFFAANLSSIAIPSTVTSIGEHAFGQNKLKSITFAKCASTLTIGYRAFNENREPTPPLVLPEGLISVGECCFLDCGLTSLTLPSTLTTVPNSAFGGNPELTTVNFSRGLVSIEEGGFGNTGIKSLNLPASLKTIGNIAFTLVKITELTLPGNVTTIGAKAFYDCPNLAKVNLPASVTSIGAQAFDECREIKFVASANPNPPVLGTDCFYWSTYQNADLLLSSDAAIERYKVANEWKRFSWLANAGIGDVEADAEVEPELPCTVYNLNGSFVTTCEADELDRLPSGVYVVRQGDKVTKICR